MGTFMAKSSGAVARWSREDHRLPPESKKRYHMPPNLRRAHQALDRAVDRLYRPNGFASERERVEHLFILYEKMRAPL